MEFRIESQEIVGILNEIDDINSVLYSLEELAVRKLEKRFGVLNQNHFRPVIRAYIANKMNENGNQFKGSTQEELEKEIHRFLTTVKEETYYNYTFENCIYTGYIMTTLTFIFVIISFYICAI